MQVPYCCTSSIEERLSRASLHPEASRGGSNGSDEENNLLVSRSPMISRGLTAEDGRRTAALALSPPRVLTLLCRPAATAEEGAEQDAHTSFVRVAICHQGPTVLVVFIPLHAAAEPALGSLGLGGLSGPTAAARPKPPRDLSLAIRFEDISILMWDTRRTNSELTAAALRARQKQQQQRSRLRRPAGDAPIRPLLHVRVLGGSLRVQRALQPPPLPASLQGGLQQLPSPRTLSVSLSVRSLHLDLARCISISHDLTRSHTIARALPRSPTLSHDLP